jgi:N-(2-amino-2-carboxyethyl)-L-glutamate synthase
MLIGEQLAQEQRDALRARLLSRSGALAAIGDTPLVPLHALPIAEHLEVYGKLEALNPAGSSKDRPALAMIERGIADGLIGPDTVIIESSSGNMAIGLAQTCAALGLRLVVVVDAKTTPLNVQLLHVYGATVEYVAHPDPATGEFLPARLQRVAELQHDLPDSFWTNQYGNDENPGSHHRTTMPEIVEELDGNLDYLFCGTGTCGTLRGCADYVKANGLTTKIVAVDAAGSVIFDTSTVGAKRRLPGLGAAVRPAMYRDDLADALVHVTDEDCVAGCRELVRREGLLLGASSGGVLAAIDRLRDDIPAGANCVAIFPDRGERYLDTVYDDKWVENTFGRIPTLW